MSILQVANVQFDSTGSNRIEYTGNNVIRVKGAGLQLPVVTNATKPSAEPGMMLYNSDTGNMEMMGAGGAGLSFASNSSVAAVFAVANTALQNTSGVSFNGNFYIPSGNVGVGTTSPVSKLDVVGMARITSAPAVFPTTGVGLELLYNGSNDFGQIQSFDRNTSSWKDLRLYSNNTLFITNATERMRVTNDGNIGIGRTSPQSKLHVEGTASGLSDTGIFEIGNTARSGISFGYDVTNNWSWIYSRSVGVTERPLLLNTGVLLSGEATKRLILNNTSYYRTARFQSYSPSVVTDSGDAGGHHAFLCATDNWGANLGATLSLGGNGGLGSTAGQTGSHVVFGSVSGRKEGSAADHAGYMTFNTMSSGGTVSERMRIDSSGRVTISNQPFARICYTSQSAISFTSGTSVIVPFNSVQEQYGGSNYNTSTYRYTAPVAGRYLITAAAQGNNLSAGNWYNMFIRVNGSNRFGTYRNGTGLAYEAFYTYGITYVNAGDFFDVVIIPNVTAGSLELASVDSRNMFCVYLLS